MSKASVVNANPDSSPAGREPAWYKQAWVWFVIALPASSVVTGIILVTVAVKNADDLVMDEWYREGRGTNRSMAAENLAAEFAIGLQANTQADGNTLIVMHANRPMSWPDVMTLILRHRTLAAQDQELALRHQAGGTYLLDGALPSGSWHIRIASEDVGWRLAGPGVISSSGELIFGALK
ncbi:MAG: FixH family protein [Alcanivoracaceae bacterium]